LSEIIKLPSRSLKQWFESETGSIFLPVHNKAQKLIDEMRKTIGDFQESCKMLVENSGKEIEKRNARTFRRARALNKLGRLFHERIQHVKVPEKVSYDSFREMVQETQKALTVTEVDIRNWFPRISPFFILDRRRFLMVFEKAKEQNKELGSFLAKDYVKTKTLEEAFQIVEELQSLERQLVKYQQEKKEAEIGRISVEKEILAVQQEIAGLRGKGELGQLGQIDAEIEVLTMKLRQSLRHLQKPFVKLQSLALHGGGSGLMQDESAKLGQYLENPFDAFASEETGYPLLRAILEKMSNSMSEKLNLKPEKERKARQAIDNILNKNTLTSLHQKCLDAVARRKQLSTSAEVANVQAAMSKLEEHLETLERKKKVVETEESVLERAYNETSEKIRNCKSKIEKNILDSVGRKIHVE
jgi:hypothetical protein